MKICVKSWTYIIIRRWSQKSFETFENYNIDSEAWTVCAICFEAVSHVS